MAAGEHVAFCGDGANDMEALSVATVGVSLVSGELLVWLSSSIAFVGVSCCVR